MEAVPGVRISQSWRTRRSPIRRNSTYLKMPLVRAVWSPWSLLRGRKQRSRRQWTKPRRRGLPHLTCCRHRYSPSIAVSSSSGPRPYACRDLRMAGNGRRGRSHRIWPASSADVSAGGTSGCKGLARRKPQDIPVELPAKFDLVVNLTTAKALGLTIPETFSGARRQGDRIVSGLPFWPFTTGRILVADCRFRGATDMRPLKRADRIDANDPLRA